MKGTYDATRAEIPILDAEQFSYVEALEERLEHMERYLSEVGFSLVVSTNSSLRVGTESSRR